MKEKGKAQVLCSEGSGVYTLCPDPPRTIRKDFLEEAAFEMDLKGFLQVEKEKTQAED